MWSQVLTFVEASREYSKWGRKVEVQDNVSFGDFTYEAMKKTSFTYDELKLGALLRIADALETFSSAQKVQDAIAQHKAVEILASSFTIYHWPAELFFEWWDTEKRFTTVEEYIHLVSAYLGTERLRSLKWLKRSVREHLMETGSPETQRALRRHPEHTPKKRNKKAAEV